MRVQALWGKVARKLNARYKSLVGVDLLARAHPAFLIYLLNTTYKSIFLSPDPHHILDPRFPPSSFAYQAIIVAEEAFFNIPFGNCVPDKDQRVMFSRHHFVEK